MQNKTNNARIFGLGIFFLVGGCATTHAPPSPDLVGIDTLVPDIAQEMRYAGPDNFTGAPVDGYEAPRCLLLRPAAQALARVEADLRADGYRLRIFDCYRPKRAVRAFVAWANAPEDGKTKAAYYPNLPKSALLGDYISPTSGHSRGATIDLTMLRCDENGCTPLDMGTPFDFFDPLANTDSPAATDAQKANRKRLVDAMAKEGFANYPMEWWHFTLKPEPTPDTFYDVPVR